MTPQDEDFIPYQDRPLPWEARRGRRRREAVGTAPEQDFGGRSGCGCPGGCGCLLAFLLAVVVAGVLLARNLPSAAGSRVLPFVVNAAIDGEITITTNGRQRRITTPEEWREPWRATAAAYADAYRDGTVDQASFYGQVWATVTSVFTADGEIDGERIRELCELMRRGLPVSVVETLPPLPPVPTVTDPASAVTAAADAWSPRAGLSEEELLRQYQERRALLTVLSRRHGTSTAQQLLPESALIFDFTYGVPPLAGVMDDWTIATPAIGTMEVAMGRGHGFAAPPSLYIAATPQAKNAEAGVSFNTHAAELRFWYAFQGPAHPDSWLRVFVDGREVHADAWPTSSPGPMGGSGWRPVHVTGLDPTVSSRVDIRATVSGTSTNCFVFIDDLVFAP